MGKGKKIAKLPLINLEFKTVVMENVHVKSLAGRAGQTILSISILTSAAQTSKMSK